MTTPRTHMLAAAAALVAAGCSNSGTPSTSAAPQTSPASKAPSTTASPSRTNSAFCLDLSTFQVAVVSFRADAGKAIRGQALDFAELRRKAKIIADYGKEMRASAPSDIAKQFETVLDAVATSTRKLKPDASVRDVVDPLYGTRNRAAFDAVQNYECR